VRQNASSSYSYGGVARTNINRPSAFRNLCLEFIYTIIKLSIYKFIKERSVYVNNSKNTANHERKDHLQRKFGAIPGFVIIGFLAWMASVFIGTFSNHDNISVILGLALVTFSIYSVAYIGKLIYSYCEENKLGILGSSSKLLGLAISISVFMLLSVFVNI
jgi:hypothetical protein